MNDNLTDITIVLDKSGSMACVQMDTIGGFNQFLKDQKAAPGDANLSLVLFDTSYELVHEGVPIKDVPELDQGTYVPGGGTALLDALQRAIVSTGSRLASAPESRRASKVIFVVMTDGQENSSREATKQGVAEMIRHQERKYSWNFVYIGANQDSFSEAGQIGIRMSNVKNYVANAVGTVKAMSEVSEGMLNYRSSKSSRVDNYFGKKKR